MTKQKLIGYTAPLLIGELQACTAVNDDGVTYIAVGPITDDEESSIGIDHIEAAALYEWLGRALRVEPRGSTVCPAPYCVLDRGHIGPCSELK